MGVWDPGKGRESGDQGGGACVRRGLLQLGAGIKEGAGGNGDGPGSRRAKHWLVRVLAPLDRIKSEDLSGIELCPAEKILPLGLTPRAGLGGRREAGGARRGARGAEVDK